MKKLLALKERATLRDIAEMAGVSLSTASQALNNKNGVAATTRERVLKAASQLGYQQQVRVSSPVANQLSTIGLIVKQDPDEKPAMDPFYYQVMKGIEEECRRMNLGLMYASVKVDEHSHAVEWPALLVDKQIDALLVVGTVIKDGQQFLQETENLPIVLIDGYAQGCTIDRIGIDNRLGARQAVEYLITSGHRHIGFIGGDADSHPSIQERRSEYFNILRKHGITDFYVEDSLVMSPDNAQEAAKLLLARHPEITAIFGATDFVAIGIVKAAHDLGIAIPDDLSLVGFDNIDMAAHTIPPLTTININKQYMGALGVRHLYDIVTYPERPGVTSLISTQLVKRKSVKQLTNR